MHPHQDGTCQRVGDWLKHGCPIMPLRQLPRQPPPLAALLLVFHPVKQPAAIENGAPQRQTLTRD